MVQVKSICIDTRWNVGEFLFAVQEAWKLFWLQYLNIDGTYTYMYEKNTEIPVSEAALSQESGEKYGEREFSPSAEFSLQTFSTRLLMRLTTDYDTSSND